MHLMLISLTSAPPGGERSERLSGKLLSNLFQPLQQCKFCPVPPVARADSVAPGAVPSDPDVRGFGECLWRHRSAQLRATRKVAVEYPIDHRRRRHVKDNTRCHTISSTRCDVTQSPQHAAGIQDGFRENRKVLFPARSGKGARSKGLSPAGVDSHRSGIGAAQLRRQESHRRACPPALELEAERAAHRRNSFRALAHPAAGPDRHPLARRPRRDEERRAAARQEPQGGRAARAGRSRRGPLHPDRPLRGQERARPQHEARVQAQPGALHLHEVGDAGVRHLQSGAAGHRHRAPGEPRIPGARGAQERRPLLSRHAGRHRQPHAHGQRHRRGRLGSGRHRSRGRHARPADLHPHPRRGRRAPEGELARRRHRHRSRAHGHRAHAQDQRRQQVRRVLRRRHGQPHRARPRDHRQHGARLRRDHGLLPGGRGDHHLLRRHRPLKGGDRRAQVLLQGAGHVRHDQERRDRLQPGGRARPCRRDPLARRPQAPAGPHRDRQGQSEVHRALLEAGRRERLLEEARGPEKTRQDPRRHGHRRGRRDDRRDHFLHQHLEPRRPARRGAARQESGRARPHGQAAREDLARAGLPGGDRISEKGGVDALPREARLQPRRLRLHDLHRQLRTAESHHRGGDRPERSRVRRRALGQPQLRGAPARARRARTCGSATSGPRRRRSRTA